MELYVKVSFWIGVVGLVVRLLFMLGGSYPRTSTNTAASDSALAMISAALVAWAWWLLYGGP